MNRSSIAALLLGAILFTTGCNDDRTTRPPDYPPVYPPTYQPTPIPTPTFNPTVPPLPTYGVTLVPTEVPGRDWDERLRRLTWNENVTRRRVDRLERSLSRTRKDLAETKDDLKDVKEDLTETRERVTKLEKDVEALKAKPAETSEDVPSLKIVVRTTKKVKVRKDGTRVVKTRKTVEASKTCTKDEDEDEDEDAESEAKEKESASSTASAQEGKEDETTDGEEADTAD